MVVNCNGRVLDLSKPKVMGIINVNEDSFYQASRHSGTTEVLNRARQMIDEGASILDIGAMSSKPGSSLSDPKTELAKLKPIVQSLVGEFGNDTCISIDTVHSSVASEMINLGVHLINDISAGDIDPMMLSVVGKSDCTYIAMHMQGTPMDMQNRPLYENVTMDVLKYFSQKVKDCEKAGVTDLILDPGFGFGKTMDQNYKLLKELDSFGIYGLPILAGVSRKSMIYKLLDYTPDEALNGTSFLHAYCLQKGASILRVHDVKEAVECLKLYEALRN